MVAEGQLDPNLGALLNGTMAAHAFCALHACTHGAVAMHNPEHEPFEAMVFRFGCMLAWVDDDYRESHKSHHTQTNDPVHDSDYGLANASLPEFGKALAIEGELEYIRLLTKPFFFWESQVFKIAMHETLHMMESQPEEYGTMRTTLQQTWKRSGHISKMILGLFFGRYPHRAGLSGEENELNSYYDSTYRGQGQVDLWMMGEGSHHIHHARPDINYSKLPRVSKELEEQNPEMKVQFRGNEDLYALEDATEPGPHLAADTAEPDQAPWERTLRTRQALQTLFEDPVEAVASLADNVFENTLRVAGQADFGLMRHIHKRFDVDSNGVELEPGLSVKEGAHLPFSGWQETVWAEKTQELLHAESSRIRAAVRINGLAVGRQVAPRIAGQSKLQDCYIEFFRAIADTFAPQETQDSFLRHMAQHFQIGEELHDRGTMWKLVDELLRSPMHSLLTESEKLKRQQGEMLQAVQKTTRILSSAVPTQLPPAPTALDEHIRGASRPTMEEHIARIKKEYPHLKARL